MMRYTRNVTRPRARWSLSEAVALISLLLLSIACAALLIAQPRAVAPLELPGLTLPAAPVLAVIEQDERDAQHAPSSATAAAFEGLLDAQGQAELQGSEETEQYIDRRQQLANGYRALVAEVGEVAALRLRAKAVKRLHDALELRLPPERAKRVIGAFSSVLEREHASRDGYLVAPRFVVRTLYKARWNILAGLEPAHALQRIERRAYYGWEALHADSVPLRQRLVALHEYGLAGGDHVEEALGTLLFRMHDYQQSARALEAAYRKDHSIRLRNYLLAAREAAGLPQ